LRFYVRLVAVRFVNFFAPLIPVSDPFLTPKDLSVEVGDERVSRDGEKKKMLS
jgi:hypothetical protein